MDNKRVLLVDDEVEFTSVLSERLEVRGMKVETVANGPDAIEQLKAVYYDAIVLDMAMPEMDGLETLEHLLEINPDVLVIFLTGKADVQKAIQAVKMGAYDFLEKPVKIDQLVERIAEAKEKKSKLIEKRAEEKIDKILKKKGW